MNIKDRVVYIATLTLMLVVIGMMVSFVFAVLDPQYDDDKIFAIIGPAFQTIVGGFIGLITGIHLGSKEEEKNEE
jgi:nitrogen fixation-related uncharacterized protein